MNFATIHTLDLESKDTFSHQIKQFIVDVLKEQIEQKLGELPVKKTPADYTRGLLVPVAQLSVQQAKGSSYSLSREYTLEKKRFHHICFIRKIVSSRAGKRSKMSLHMKPFA